MLHSVFRARVPISEMKRLLIEKVTRQKNHHVRGTAAAVAQIYDQRIRVGQKIHCAPGCLAAELRAHEAIHFQIADVAR